MGWCEEPKKIQIGDREWSYQVCWNDFGKCEAVMLYADDNGNEFITEFYTVDDMKDFLYHADAETVNEELDMVWSFRKRCKKFLESERGKRSETSISKEEKEANSSIVMKRLQILKGDMNNYEFGKVIGLGGGQVFNLMAGARNVGSHTLKRIADRCGVPTDWILGR